METKGPRRRHPRNKKGRMKRLMKHFSPAKDNKIQQTTLSIEILWSFFEYYLVLIISGAVTKTSKDIFMTRLGHVPRSILETAIYLFFQLSFLHFILAKQGKKFGCKSFADYSKLLGLRSFSWSIMGSYMMLYHVGLFLMMLYVQYSEDNYYYTFENFYPARVFSLRWFVSTWFLSPIREEVYFRGCVFTTALHRSKFLSIPILLTGVVFGGAHLVNLFNPHISKMYVILQVLVAVVVGIFYCLRFLVTGTLWESILLHMANNITSSFLPQNEDFDMVNPKIGLPMTCTLMLYAIMAYQSLQQLKKHKIWGECFKEKLDEVHHPFERLKQKEGMSLENDENEEAKVESEEEENVNEVKKND